jgi:hypothetical protein
MDIDFRVCLTAGPSDLQSSARSRATRRACWLIHPSAKRVSTDSGVTTPSTLGFLIITLACYRRCAANERVGADDLAPCQPAMSSSNASTSKVSEYIDTARAVAEERGTATVDELVALLRFRWHTGRGPVFYMLYSLFGVEPAKWNQYMTKDELMRMQKQVNDLRAFDQLDDKLAFHDVCNAAGIPMPEILAIVRSYGQSGDDPRSVTTADTFASFIGRAGTGDLVFKRTRGSYGEGFWAMRSDGLALTSLKDGRTFEPRAFFDLLVGSAAAHVVQRRLQRCRELADVMPGEALGTVRVVTYVDRQGLVSVPWAFIKLPVGGQVSDNFAHGSSGNLLCGIDVDTGTMMHAFSRRPGRVVMTKFDRHPETGTPLPGRAVPRWHEITAICKRAAMVFPSFRTIGWDVAVTDDHVVVLEGNRTYDPDGMQITLERGIRAEINALYAS